MKKNITTLVITILVMTFSQLFGFEYSVPTEAEVQTMEPTRYDASIQAGTQLSAGCWELRAKCGRYEDTADRDWPAFGQVETLVIEYDITSHVTLHIGSDSVSHAVLSEHNAVFVHLYAGASVPWNTLTINEIRVNGVKLDGVTPMQVEDGFEHHDYLLISDLPKVGVNVSSYRIEFDIVFDTVLGARSSFGDLRLDVCGVFIEEEEQEIDPSTLEYATTSMSDVSATLAVIAPTGGGGGNNVETKLTWKGTEGVYYQLKVSTDLIHWEVIPDTYFHMQEGELLEYIDEEAHLYKRRFYQLMEAEVD